MERIKKINKIFNATDEELKEIYECETDLVKIHLENQFSNFFTRSKKITLSDYEKQIFPIIQEIVTIDVLCLHKLGSKEEFETFLSENNIIERIKFAYNIDSLSMVTNLNIIPQKSRRAIELLFNLTGENLNVDEVLDVLNINYDDLNRLVRTNMRFLYLNSVKKNVEEKPRKNVFVLPNFFFDYFEKKGYYHDDIELAIEEYSDDIKSTLKKLYGKYFNKEKSTEVKLLPEDIQNLKTVFISKDKNVAYIIEERIKSIKIPKYYGPINEFNLKDYYISMGYPKEIVSEVLEELSTINKEIINTYFYSDYTLKVPKKFIFGKIVRNGETNSIYNLLFNPNKGIQKNIKDKIASYNLLNCSSSGMIINIYRFYQKLGYEREIVEKAFKQFSIESLNMISKFYDSNLVLKETHSQNIGIQKSATTSLINPDNVFAENILNDSILPQYDSSVTENVYTNYYVHLGIRGIPANYVKKAVLLLSSEEKSILNKYYTNQAYLRDNVIINEEELTSLFDKIIYFALNYNELIDMNKKEKYKSVRNVLIDLGCSPVAALTIINDLDEQAIDKIISLARQKNCTTDDAIAVFTNLIIDCTYVNNISNLKNFFLSLGYTETEFIEFLHIINKYGKDFDLTSYFDIDTFELKASYRLNKEKLVEIRHYLDYFITLLIHYKSEKSNIVNADNIYYSMLNDTKMKIKKSTTDYKIVKASICQKFAGKCINYYILLSGLLTNHSFDGITELLLYKSLFNKAFEIYTKDKNNQKKKINKA